MKRLDIKELNFASGHAGDPPNRRFAAVLMKNISKNITRRNLFSSDARRLEFHISYQCNNNCVFCGERFRLEKNKNKFVDFSLIEKKIKEKKRAGCSHVTLTGGEPTFHPEFLDILKLAKKQGFKTYVSTNGGLFAYPDFCRQAAPFLDEICFSIHGHNARLHNRQTGNQQSFKILKKALENSGIYLKNTKFFSNTVVSGKNFEFLPEIIEFVADNGVRQALISNLVPEGNGSVGYKKLAVRLKEFKKIIPNLVKIANKKNIDLRLFGLPLCVLGVRYKDYSNDIWWSPRITLEKAEGKRKLILDEVESILPVRNRTKTKRCVGCAERKICGGVFLKYIQDFGQEEIKPVK